MGSGPSAQPFPPLLTVVKHGVLFLEQTSQDEVYHMGGLVCTPAQHLV